MPCAAGRAIGRPRPRPGVRLGPLPAPRRRADQADDLRRLLLPPRAHRLPHRLPIDVPPYPRRLGLTGPDAWAVRRVLANNIVYTFLYTSTHPPTLNPYGGGRPRTPLPRSPSWT